MSVLIRRAEVGGSTIVDVRLARGRIAALDRGPLPALPGERVLDAAGGALIPGLHDHHVHLLSLAAAACSVRVGSSEVTGPEGFRAALRDAPGTGPDGWVRAIGYHPSVAGDLDRAALDAVCPDRPVRVQHRGGALWTLNSRALDLTGADACARPGMERDAAGRLTGRVWRLDDWLRRAVPRVPVDLAAVGRSAAAAGVVGFTEATPDRSAEDTATLAAAVRAGDLPQRVTLLRAEGPTTAAEDRTAGRERSDRGAFDPADPFSPAGDRLGWGPVKVMLDDDTLPDPDHLAERFAAVHRAGVPVAVHCVTRVQLVVTLAALAGAGRMAGDRIEHGAVVPPDLHGEVRGRGLVVVTQPNFVAERGDRYRAEVVDEDPASLYPAGSLLRAGIALAAGTDAPFGGPDPWLAVRAAMDRRTGSGAVLGAAERVTGRQALALFLGSAAAPARARTVRVGARADLCVLDAPLDEALDAVLREPSTARVRYTVVGGRLVHAAGEPPADRNHD